jgi:glutathione synthase/RimK-type ligase-like ATP-grasp enzyme
VSILFVVNNPDNWPLNIPDVEVVSAKQYLTDPSYHQLRGAKVFNLCRSYSYQSLGYYVSLLAEARGHKPQPSIATIQALKLQTLTRMAGEDLNELIQRTLRPIRSDDFEMSIYFGRPLAKRDRPLALQLFNQFQAPLLRASFVRKGGKWQIRGITAISSSDIPEAHHNWVVQAAGEHFAGRTRRPRAAPRTKYDLAILVDPEEPMPPSNAKAIERFTKAAISHGLAPELITRDDYGRIAEFDALFIRATTSVNHYTYRFARRAAAEGLIVIDDPLSISRCTNKVYLAELLAFNKIATPKTVIVHKDNADTLVQQLGLPLVLKQPDSSFSQGVVRVDDQQQLTQHLESYFDSSDLVVAQAYMPTEFDWRVGILDRRPLYVCRYYMARRHWQIYKNNGDGDHEGGNVDTLPVEAAPNKVVKTALKAANLIGDGFYGVDLKQVGNNFYVIEVNDNPSIDRGFEDRVLKDQLYEWVMAVFLRRIEQQKLWGVVYE